MDTKPWGPFHSKRSFTGTLLPCIARCVSLTAGSVQVRQTFHAVPALSESWTVLRLAALDAAAVSVLAMTEDRLGIIS